MPCRTLRPRRNLLTPNKGQPETSLPLTRLSHTAVALPEGTPSLPEDPGRLAGWAFPRCEMGART